MSWILFAQREWCMEATYGGRWQKVAHKPGCTTPDGYHEQYKCRFVAFSSTIHGLLYSVVLSSMQPYYSTGVYDMRCKQLAKGATRAAGRLSENSTRTLTVSTRRRRCILRKFRIDTVCLSYSPLPYLATWISWTPRPNETF